MTENSTQGTVTCLTEAASMNHSLLNQPLSADPGPGQAEGTQGKEQPGRPWLIWPALALLVLLVGVGVVVAVQVNASRRHSPPRMEAAGKNGNGSEDEENIVIPVNTVFPKKKPLVRTLEQPGTIKAWAQAELYAKSSGYLKALKRDVTPQMVAELVGQNFAAGALAPLGVPDGSAIQCLVGAELAWWRAPQIDYESLVHAGDVLIQIAIPELIQDIAQKESLWRQSRAELEEARIGIKTFEASLEAAKAQIKLAEADVKTAKADHVFHTTRLGRLLDLAKRTVVAEEVLDEEQKQVDTALAAWERSQAKVQAAQADLVVVSSKLATARADLQVKEAKVQVAREDLNRAKVQAEYANISAPFDGMITYRGVDEGDFVQNSTTGQTQLLMTVTAIDKVKVVLQVPERQAVWVRVGAKATVQVDALSNWQVAGRVARRSNTLDPQTRTMRVEIDLDNPDHKLLSGMYGHVVLNLQEIDSAQVIPATAVYSHKGGHYILRVEDGVVRRQRVRILYDDGKELEVAKLVGGKEVPLKGTEELVVSNKGEIGDGQHVQATHLNGD